MKAIIIDDEPLAHKIILQYAKDIPFLEIVGQCYLATEAYALLSTQNVDLLFLDIQMPKLKGLDFLRTLQQQPQVIVTSAYEEYAIEGYELQICDYLLKPFRFERFLKAVNKAQQHLQLLQQPAPQTLAAPAKEPEASSQLFIKVDKRFLQIHLKDIQYLESYGNYVKVWVDGEFHLTPRTLSSFEAELPASDFSRIHKSYIVQKAYVAYIEGNMLKMKNGQQLAIGKNYRKDVKGWM